MITTISFKNFKCFGASTMLPVGRINLLTGINGRGKSTTLQGLLLMRQSPEHSRTTDKIIFNGSCIDLGNFDDVKNSNISRSEAIELSFQFNSADNHVDLHYFLRENPEDDMVAQIERVEIQAQAFGERYNIEMNISSEQPILHFNGNTYPLTWKNLLFETIGEQNRLLSFVINTASFVRIHYVSADRIGPKDYYAKQSFAEFPNVGRRGEYTANMLSKKGGDTVQPLLSLDSGLTTTVLDQTEAWLNEIFKGGSIKIEIPEANIVLVSLNSERSSKTYKPINVGFGYSYALPIIVSGLIARPGEMLIVENPEAHLHPYAQSQIIRFLARVSACGIQVFIESHSDHILNGLRLAVLDKVISSDDLNVLYFDKEISNSVHKISVNADGSIEDWPPGFFDQMDKDFARLFGV